MLPALLPSRHPGYLKVTRPPPLAAASRGAAEGPCDNNNIILLLFREVTVKGAGSGKQEAGSRDQGRKQEGSRKQEEGSVQQQYNNNITLLFSMEARRPPGTTSFGSRAREVTYCCKGAFKAAVPQKMLDGSSKLLPWRRTVQQAAP